MKKIAFFIVIVLATNSIAQNLVLNSSFEELASCASYSNEISLCTGWESPSGNYAEWFNSCSPYPDFSVPNNIFGSQPANTGEAYTEFYTYTVGGCFPISSRQYILTKLSEPLIANEEYEVSFYVNLADSSYYRTNIGAEFYFTKPALNVYDIPNITPVVNFESLTTSVNKNEWTKLSQKYIAKGGEEYIMIGNFSDDMNSQIDTLAYHEPWSMMVYFCRYFIDDVYVGKTQKTFIPNVFSPNNDNVNDSWNVTIQNARSNIQCSVLDRWGKLVFTETASEIQWNGKNTQQSNCNIGTYYYVLQYENQNMQNEKISGYITLVQ